MFCSGCGIPSRETDASGTLLEDAIVEIRCDSQEEYEVPHPELLPRLPPCHSMGERGDKLSIVGRSGGEGDAVAVSA